MPFDFVVKKIDKNSAEEAATLIVAVFNEREPLASMNPSDPQEFAEYILYLTHKCAEENLGFIAREVDSNKIVGAVLSSDLYETVNSEDTTSEDRSNPIAALIRALNSAYFAGNELEEETYLSIKFVATDSDFKGKGVVTKLISRCINEAKGKGFKYAQVEATGNISQHIFINKLGFVEKGVIRYSDFEFGGEKPFSPITEHEGIKLLIKDL